MSAPPDPPVLFDVNAPEPERPGALPYLAADTGTYNQALAGDGYAWLARVLAPPNPLSCPRCRRPMVLPAVRLLWQCPTCDNDPDSMAGRPMPHAK